MNLADIGGHWARWQPDDIAITFRGDTTSWHQLDARTDRLARGLAQLGVGRGHRVSVLMTNRPEWCEVCIACWKLGAVLVPLNVRFTAVEVAYVVDDSGSQVIVSEDAMRPGLTQLGPHVTVLLAEGLANVGPDGHPFDGDPFDEEPFDVADVDGSTPAFLCYTSGTTGDPKGAVLTHESWNVASQGWAQAIQLSTADRVVLPFPLAFTGGLAVFLFTYWAGARLVLEPAVDIDRLFDLFETERVTALLAVPVIHQQLVDHPRFAAADLSSWRIASSGGAPVPVTLLRSVQARGVPMLQGFSLTEASAAATILPAADALRKLGSAGLPVMHARIAIEDGDGRRCPTGEVGEILVTGPQVMSGYWNNPAATAAALVDGWLHTGDLGYLDEDGYLFVVDRKKDMVISGGLNIYPAEIERVLGELESVIEVAVIGVPDARWGETPAVIAWTNGAPLSGDDVLSACRGLLADYKLPRYLVLTDAPLPRNMSGKILKRHLKDQYTDLQSTYGPIR